MPTIRIRAGELHKTATEAEAALIGAGAPFYVRSGEIVRPVVDEVDAAKGRKTKVARLMTVTADVMLDHLSRAAAWEKWYVRKEEWVPADPPKPVAATVLARDGEWTFPRLVGVITTPTLRPDCSILDRPGYDHATRLLLTNPPDMPRLTDQPTRDDALAALQLLDDLLADFPFVDQASRSVAQSALITPVVRGSLPVAPPHAARAPSAGSGKSYLMDLASAIATGQLCPVIAAGRDEAETEKRLGAALMAGYPIVSIDNLNGELGGDALCQAIERPVVLIRVLGFSELKRIESRATMFATGNNIQPTGDVVRRVVLCSLDPEMERPELRKFHADPLGEILADRGQYVAAALTIVRAYAVAGHPDPRPALASFDEWSLAVRSALVWLDQADPVDTMETARGEDSELALFRAVVSTWAAAFGTDQRMPAGELKARAEDDRQGHLLHPEVHQALVEAAGGHGVVDAKRLGHYLGRRAGRIIEGMKLIGDLDGKRKQKVWCLRRV